MLRLEEPYFRKARAPSGDRVRIAQKAVGGGADFWLVYGLSAIGQQTLNYCPKPERHLSTWP